MTQHVLKTDPLPTTTGPPGNVSQAAPTPWRLDLSAGTQDGLLVGVSVAVFGFPALVICLLCAFRLRVYYVDSQNPKLGYHTAVEESSLLFVEDYRSRCGSHVNIKLATINEALQEEDDEEEDSSTRSSSLTTRPIVVTLDNIDNSYRSDPV